MRKLQVISLYYPLYMNAQERPLFYSTTLLLDTKFILYTNFVVRLTRGLGKYSPIITITLYRGQLAVRLDNSLWKKLATIMELRFCLPKYASLRAQVILRSKFSRTTNHRLIVYSARITQTRSYPPLDYLYYLLTPRVYHNLSSPFPYLLPSQALS